jgi:ABC-2 type transport system ATP-binding protein
VVLSTHLIDEVADLLEHVVMLDCGRVVLDAPADDVRGTAMTVSGAATAVEEFVADRPVWHRQRLGARASPPSAGSPSDGRPGAGLRTAAGRYALQ